GAVVAFGVEYLGGELRPLVVTRDQRLGFDQQLSPRVWPVGVEVAQVGHIDQLVVDYRGGAHLAVVADEGGFGGAVTVHQRQVEVGVGERFQLGGDRGGGCHC